MKGNMLRFAPRKFFSLGNKYAAKLFGWIVGLGEKKVAKWLSAWFIVITFAIDKWDKACATSNIFSFSCIPQVFGLKKEISKKLSFGQKQRDFLKSFGKILWYRFVFVRWPIYFLAKVLKSINRLIIIFFSLRTKKLPGFVIIFAVDFG